MAMEHCTSIYLDNSATTRLCSAAIEKMQEAVSCFGNPSSLHHEGLSAEKMLRVARNEIFNALHLTGSRGYRIVFTSGGTEANNLALFGIAKAKNYRGKPRIILSDSEHACVMGPANELSMRGFDIVKLTTKGGKIDENELYDALNDQTILLSIMAVNNETGAIYDVGKLFRMAKQKVPGILCHTDAVQAFLKLDLSPAKLNADLMTVSSHKIHGPKGSGALIIAEPVIRSGKIAPILVGGGQEENLRSGTENVIGICGFGGAAKAGAESLASDRQKMAELRAYLISNLPNGVTGNLPPVAAPHILSLTCDHIKSETMLHYLSSKGICVSSGSACSSHGKHGSYVLSAFGLTPLESDCTIRVSLCSQNTKKDADCFLTALEEGMRTLVRIRS